jgi:hypothetical protein
LGIVASIVAFAVPAGAAAAEDASPIARKPGSVDIFATAFIGDGLRFNNPYRLAKVLGQNARSLSRTATYTDVGAAFALGDPTSGASGMALRVSAALEGVPQAALTPSYLLFRRFSYWAAYARAGAAIILSPDTTWGFEGAAGGIWFARAGIGIVAELVGDVFFGAATREAGSPTYPVLSGQGGLWLSWEALP